MPKSPIKPDASQHLVSTRPPSRTTRLSTAPPATPLNRSRQQHRLFTPPSQVAGLSTTPPSFGRGAPISDLEQAKQLMRDVNFSQSQSASLSTTPPKRRSAQTSRATPLPVSPTRLSTTPPPLRQMTAESHEPAPSFGDGGGEGDGWDYAFSEYSSQDVGISSESNRVAESVMYHLDRDDAAMVDIKKLDSVRGHITQINRYGDWGRGRLIPESGGASISIVGKGIAELAQGDSVVLYGSHKNHPSFGEQFDTVLSAPDATSVPALRRYLIKNFKGVGDVMAKRIVDHYQEQGEIEQLRKDLIYHPSSLDFVAVIGRKAELIEDEDTKHGRINTLFALEYGVLGIRTSTINHLARSVRSHIEKLSTDQLRKVVVDIEKRKAQTDQSDLPIDLADSQPDFADELPFIADELYAGEVIAEYERLAGLPFSGFAPKVSAIAKAAQLEDEDPFLTAVDWHELDDILPSKLTDSLEPQVGHVRAAHLILADNPYFWIPHTEGYSFKVADRIGHYEGIAPDNPNRVRALVVFALEQGCEQQGHSFIDASFLKSVINRIDGSIDENKALEEALLSGMIDRDGDRFYPKGLLSKEKALSAQIAKRIHHQTKPLVGWDFSAGRLDAVLDAAQAIVGERKGIENFQLDATQRAAVKGILMSESSLHVIEGGAGRGKTAIVQVLMETLNRLDVLPETAFCAPVGKAAKVLNSQITHYGNAQTIHSLLGARGVDHDFVINKESPLEAELVVADEQSMTGLNLGHALFDATKPAAHIILLGDTNQLLPIDCGNVMKSITALEDVDKYMLTVTHRNKGQILSLVDAVNEGWWPTSSADVAQVERDGDVVLHNDQNALHPNNLTPFLDRVERAITEYGSIENVGVICPMRRGSVDKPNWNVTYLNHALRERLNPDPDSSKSIIGSTHRINDRVIITKNMRVIEFNSMMKDEVADFALGDTKDLPKVRVANGDTGYLRQPIISEVNGTLQAVGYVIGLDDGRSVLLGLDEKDHLGLAYAITVHAAQGSEYKKVFGVVTNGQDSFMHRALLMTMLSRAKESLEVFGQREVCARVAANLPPHRNCGIFERADEQIQIYIDKEQESHQSAQARYQSQVGA